MKAYKCKNTEYAARKGIFMNYIGMKIIHTCFGEGIIREFDGKVITAEFAAGTKRLAFKQVFSDGLVKAASKKDQEKILLDIATAEQNDYNAIVRRWEVERAERDAKQKEEADKAAALKKEANARKTERKLRADGLAADGTRLIAGAKCLSSARKDYEDLCGRFGFDKEKADSFVRRMSAAGATPEGYGVRYVQYNAENEEKRPLFLENDTRLKLPANADIKGKWLVFARKSSSYQFMGVYQPAGEEETVCERVSECYPEK